MAAAVDDPANRFSRSGVSSPGPHPTTVNSGPTQEGRYIPTLSLDPKNIELIKGVDETNIGYIRPAIAAFGIIHAGLQKLSDAREAVKRDTSKTEANQVLLCAVEAEKLMDRSTRAFDDARKRLIDGIKSLDDSLSAPLTTKADNSISAEIRAHFKSLPTGKREEAIADAVNRKDLTTLTAVLGGPSYLSGMTPEMQAQWTRQYRELTTPDIVVRLDVMKKAQELVEARAGLIFTETERALAAPWSIVKKLRETNDAAAQALLLVNPAAV